MLFELGGASEAVLHNNIVLTIGMFLGFIAALVLSTLLLFLLSKDRKFVVYAVGLLCQSLGLVIFYGYLPIPKQWYYSSIITLAFGYILCAVWYALIQLEVRNYSENIVRPVRYVVIFGLLMLGISWFSSAWLASILLLIYTWSACLLMVSTGLFNWRRQVMAARWFTCAWLCVGIGLIYVSYMHINQMAIGLWAVNIVVCVFWFANVLWFIGAISVYVEDIKHRISSNQRQLDEAHKQQALQEQKFEMEEQMREELEVKVQERSFELEVTLRELEEKNRELEEKSTQDALTGMRNRRFFDRKYLAETRRSRREHTMLSIVMLDIDHFKKVNDQYGHLAGDDVIRFVGRTITDMIKRHSDEGCRYGGEEFAIILPSTDKFGAISLAESIREKIASTEIDTAAGPVKVTMSFGIYTDVADAKMSANYYIELADKALYRAKQTGRNKVVHYADCAALS